MDDYIIALNRLTWYNGLAETVYSWQKLKPHGSDVDVLLPPENYGCPTKDPGDIAQLQVVWMIAVSLFGNWGTSPRYAWIENKEDFYKWCKKITSLWQEDKEARQNG